MLQHVIVCSSTIHDQLPAILNHARSRTFHRRLTKTSPVSHGIKAEWQSYFDLSGPRCITGASSSAWVLAHCSERRRCRCGCRPSGFQVFVLGFVRCVLEVLAIDTDLPQQLFVLASDLLHLRLCRTLFLQQALVLISKLSICCCSSMNTTVADGLQGHMDS